MAVVGARFYCDHPVNLVYENHIFRSDKVKDANGNLVFKIRTSPVDITIEDASSGSLLILLTKKTFSMHGIWHAADAENRLLFTVREPSWLSTRVEVFVGSYSDAERAPDFVVKEKTFSRSCEVLRGDDLTLVAETRFPHPLTPDFDIQISPGADFALVTAMITIANKKQNDSSWS